MSSRRDTDRLRPRRPRIIQDDYSDSAPSDNNDKNNNDYRNDRSRPTGRAPPRAPQPFDDGRDAAAAATRAPPLHTRPRSKVRLQEPADSSDSDTTTRRHDRSGPRRARTDLERKNRPEHEMFRSRRDGYTSDEGEALRKSRRGPPRANRRLERDSSDSDRRDGYRRSGRNGERGVDPALVAAGGAGGAAGAALPIRSRNARPKSMDPSRAPYPEDGYEVAPRRQRMRPDYDTDPDGPPVRRRGTRGEPLPSRKEPRPRYNDDYYDSPSPPRRRDGGGRRPPPPPAYDDRDRGYRSDHGGRRRGDEGYGYGDRDPYDRSRGGGRAGDGYRSDHGPSSRRDFYDDPRSSRRDRDRYDTRRDSRYDDGYDRRSDARARSSGARGRGGSSKGKKGMLGGFKLDDNWQKGATDAFLLYGLPLLKKEGPKWAKQATNYWAKRGGG